MRTFNDIATDMRVLAKEIGGDHVDNKEAEKRLKELAYELSYKSFLVANQLHNFYKGFGYSDEYLKDVKLALIREKKRGGES